MKKLKTTIAFAVIFIAGSKAYGQQLTIDPIMTGTVAIGGSQQNSRLDEMKDHQTKIQQYQALAVTQLGFINQWQKKMYDGLTTVAAVVRDSKNVLEATSIVNDIIKYQLDAANYAKGNPLLIIFAQKTEAEFKGTKPGFVYKHHSIKGRQRHDDGCRATRRAYQFYSY
jgi:hypothetical protein